MKRLLKLLAATFALVLLLLGVFVYATFGSLASPKDEPLPGVGYVVQDGYVTVGVIEVGDGKVALVDGGNDPDGAALLAGLSQRSVTPADVVAIFLTHGHPDHVAACGHFPGAKVYALAAEVPYIAGELPFDGPLPHAMGVQPARAKVTDPLQDEQTVAVGNRLVEVFAIPGHTHGSAAWLVDGTLFLGDSASLTKDGELVGAPWIFSDSQAENVASLKALSKRLSNRQVTTLVTSHSGTAPGLAPLTRMASGEHP